MTQAGPLVWHTGAGWIILASNTGHQIGEMGDVDAAGLGWARPNRPIAVLLTAGGSTAAGEALLDYYVDLGGPEGYIVPIFDAASAQDITNCGLLAQAGLIYIADGTDLVRLVRALRDSPAMSALIQAYEEGACVVAVGKGAVALGAWVPSPEDLPQGERGLALLQNMLIEPAFVGSESAEQLRELLKGHSECLGIGIPTGLAVALGPGGDLRIIGEGQVTVVLDQIGE